DLLTQLLITQPELLASLADPTALERPRTRAGLRAALAPVFAPGLTPGERRDSLRRLKQAEELTIVWRYLLGATSIDGYSRGITPAGVAFAVDLRLRPGSKGSGFAASVDALGRYYEEHGDLWERQTLTRARLVLGDRRLARRVRATLRRLVYGAPLPESALKEITEVRTRMEVELGKETPGRRHVKLGRGGLVDVEFLAQA